MEKQKRWQFALIVVVILLTIYNILPTVLYYSRPLNEPIGEKKGMEVAAMAAERVNSLESETINWLKSYNKLHKIKASSITLDPENPELVYIDYTTEADANQMRQHLTRAGSLIPFAPAQFTLVHNDKDQEEKRLTIQRKIPIHFNEKNLKEYFAFTQKRDSEGKITPLYRQIIDDRLLQLGLAVAGSSENAQYLEAALRNIENPRADEFIQVLSQNINAYAKIFGEASPIAKRYYATLTQNQIENKALTIDQAILAFERVRDQIKLERIQLEETAGKKKESGSFLDTNEQQRLNFLKSREEKLSSALGLLRRQGPSFKNGSSPLTQANMHQNLARLGQSSDSIQVLHIGQQNPLIQSIVIDWNNETVSLELHKDILEYKKGLELSKSYLREQLDQLIYNEIARISRSTGEHLSPKLDTFSIELNTLTNSESLLVLNLDAIAKTEGEKLAHLIKSEWNPTHPDLKRENFPIYDYQSFKKLPPHKQKIGLVVFSATEAEGEFPAGSHSHSVYVVAKGVQDILAKHENNPNSTQAQGLIKDFTSLRILLQNNGFKGYPGSAFALNETFAKDFIFEAEDFYSPIINATREDFTVRGTRKFATLEFTNLEQRLLTLNKIETKEHEDLIKWHDEYRAAQVSTTGNEKWDIPAPTKSVLWNNLALSARKYFRGDERKILHWGLDLSGGKTVQIELRDANNKVVTKDADLKQGIDELYSRVNKMGVSEVNIRQEGSKISLDFPSAQGFSAADLVKASSMYFHIVNEKFSGQNKDLSAITQQFLLEVWNEAVVTNRKDSESVNQIAWKHLYGDTLDTEMAEPRSEAAKILYNHGLRLASIHDSPSTGTFNDSVSKIALYRGESHADWHNQLHPLLIVMKNYALEGANLTDVHSSYDPAKGHFLSFKVKGSQTLSDGQKVNPRNELYNWTATFSKEKVQGTPLDQYTRGEGWRMAVILNGSVVNTATIMMPLSDNVSISGNFSQSEVNRLEADLKAGSLTFAPHILSEKNVSPELGLKDRTMGIIATIVALLAVIVMMVGYYRFAGVIASVAVLFNLLIIWAALQNISATVTLAGIAGIILTVGMAVDANVLVFERIREEFAISGRIASAVQAGYRKAFSAILDSNVTTIIAALILLNFDSGPIKGLAVTLIIGIVSSMFTALFMTRFFFAGWVQNPKNKVLKMVNIIRKTQVNFLKYGKTSLYASLAIALIGGYLLIKERSSMLGMDFTGGYSVTLEVEPKDVDYRKAVEEALISAGAKHQDFQVRVLSPSTNIKILLGRSLDQKGKPFESMPLETDKKNVLYSYENNPRLVWVVDALKDHSISLTSQSLKNLESNWTSISGQMSDAMRNNALMGLTIALVCILIYITFRFEFKYAISATLGLAVDVIVTIALVSILHALKVPVQIDLNTIAALMTIVGYSLNDTIIIFDRIREDLKLMRKHSFRDVINHALNVTLSRTIMTSGTTLVVLLTLLCLGGSTTFGLSLVMVIGVVFGTFSSLFIAAPLLLFFHGKEQARIEKLVVHEN